VPKVNEVFLSATPGVLLLDEAYGIPASDQGFGKEAIDTIVGNLTGNAPDGKPFSGRLSVVMCGYETPMRELLTRNAGLASRFPSAYEIHFPAWRLADGVGFCEELLAKAAPPQVLAPEAKVKVEELLARIIQLSAETEKVVGEEVVWHSGRTCKTLAQQLSMARALRVARPHAVQDEAERVTVSEADVASVAVVVTERNAQIVASALLKFKNKCSFEAEVKQEEQMGAFS
jgi:hypothetical protein